MVLSRFSSLFCSCLVLNCSFLDGHRISVVAFGLLVPAMSDCPKKSEATNDRVPLSDATGPNDPNGPVTFLRLPPEIRNMIYKLTLTSPHGLMLNVARKRSNNRRGSFTTVRCVPCAQPPDGLRCEKNNPKIRYDKDYPSSSRDFNNLRFVNKLLYQETSGLELKYASHLLVTDGALWEDRSFGAKVERL
ncbi:hypothetical protein M011DRAFT_508243 [Sporormia fimetaria CBS 119925]|uniref:F-box domain-containing protein n=1 Tax=Sporormia fimetaria CBS 119925 TaxID=1340428 RepID=A0A6A6V0C0_9PLEO|nr:hypothetical protein M011DRAFT_508243 [Sporormia fimetaria CBS 119925]